jgi:hypothetical protein
MWWPVMLADPRGRRVTNKFPVWIGTQASEVSARILRHATVLWNAHCWLHARLLKWD